jgi:hypothetical protein
MGAPSPPVKYAPGAEEKKTPIEEMKLLLGCQLFLQQREIL